MANAVPNLKGRKPAPATPASSLREDDLFGNMLKLDPTLSDELEKKGLVGRFVDGKKLYETGGYHAKGWVVYKRTALSDNMGLSDFKYGNDPDGIVRRGSLVLAVKTKENVAKHREFLRQKAERYSTVVRRHADDLRQTARDRNVETFVDESYDEKE